MKDSSCAVYWAELEGLIEDLQLGSYVRKEIRYIPDGDVGLLAFGFFPKVIRLRLSLADFTFLTGKKRIVTPP